MPQHQGFGHVTLSVSDLDRSADFYNRAFSAQSVAGEDELGPFVLCLGQNFMVGLRRWASTPDGDAFQFDRVGLDHMGIHVESDALARADAFAVADALAGAIGPESADLILTGLQSDDMGFGQTGVILGERLGVPHATIIMDVQVQGGGLRVKRELEGGWFQWLEMPMPALLTIQSGINQLRYATLKGIMAAKKKEIRTVTPAAPQATLEVLDLRAPDKQKQTRMITGTPAEAAKELVRALREDARVVTA